MASGALLCWALVCGCQKGGESVPVPAAGKGPALTEDEFTRRRLELRDKLARQIKDPRVLDAMATIPRHKFVPEIELAKSYDNVPVPIGPKQTIPQPSLVAGMTELLEIKETDRVLEVGTGSGYHAAVLGRLAAEVYTVEIRKSFKEAAETKLRDLEKRGILTCKNMTVLQGDGAKGWPENAPYDAILVTAAAAEVPDELIQQLKPGGRLLIPVGVRFQALNLIRKLADGTTSNSTKDMVRFMRLE